ncbi:golgin candidate 4-like [Glycine soja]|uniref:golgin candidate 4-like n=1 Tax=Glycine soja TaxID=3848 RepID=UPI00103E600C|nr:golgin candidate 4-like [Glycine soja]
MARSSRLKPDERVKKYIDWNQLEVRDSKITSTEIREDAGDELVVAEQQLLGCKRIEEYKAEINRLEVSEAEIKALAVNYAALLKERGTKHQSHQHCLEKADKARRQRLSSSSASAKSDYMSSSRHLY